MISSISAITKLTIKQCFKTYYVWILFALSILCVVGAHGRGSDPEMVRQISLCWLPIAILTIFGVGVLWMGCSSISQDIEENRFIGTAVAPVKMGVVWIGRWIGLLLSTALILGAVYFLVGINGMVSVGTERPHEKLELLPNSKDNAADEVYKQLIMVNDSLTENQQALLLKEINTQLSGQYFPLSPGNSLSWSYSLDKFKLIPKEKIYISLSFLSMLGMSGGADGVIKIYADELEEPIEQFYMTSDRRGRLRFELPTDKLINASTLHVVYENAQEETGGVRVFIGYDDSIEVEAPNGNYWMNLFFAYMMSLGLISIMAALGITYGMQYSFPVAIFSAFVMMLMLVIASGNVINEYDFESSCGHNHNGEEEKPALFYEMVHKSAQGISSAVHYTTSAFIDEEPLSKLGSNRTISGSKVFEWSLISFIIIPFFLCIIGSAVLSKKEYK